MIITAKFVRGNRKKSFQPNSLSPAQMAHVRKRLAELAAEYGSELQAAIRVGIAQQRYNQIVRGDTVGYHVAKQIASHDRVPVAFVLEGGSRAFEEAIRAHRARWSEWTIAGLFTYVQRAGDEGRDAAAWCVTLDDVEHMLGAILRRDAVETAAIATSRKEAADFVAARSVPRQPLSIRPSYVTQENCLAVLGIVPRKFLERVAPRCNARTRIGKSLLVPIDEAERVIASLGEMEGHGDSSLHDELEQPQTAAEVLVRIGREILP